MCKATMWVAFRSTHTACMNVERRLKYQITRTCLRLWLLHQGIFCHGDCRVANVLKVRSSFRDSYRLVFIDFQPAPFIYGLLRETVISNDVSSLVKSMLSVPYRNELHPNIVRVIDQYSTAKAETLSMAALLAVYDEMHAILV